MIKYLHDKCAEIYDEVVEGSTNTLKVIIEKYVTDLSLVMMTTGCFINGYHVQTCTIM